MKNKFYEIANMALVVIFELMIICILTMVMFLYDKMEYSKKVIFEYPNQVLFLIGILITGILTFLIYKNKESLERNLSRLNGLVYIIGLIYLAALIYVGYSIYFECAWDPEMLHTSANLIVEGTQREVFDLTDYFSTYPNNLMLTAIFAIILKINYKWGVFTANQGLMSLIVCECILYVITGIIVYKAVFNLLKSYLAAWTAYIGFFVWGVALWAFVPYSDATALIFPVTIYYIYQKLNNKRREKNSISMFKEVIFWILITILAVIGYNIKPQAVIMFIAVIMVELIKIFENNKEHFKVSIMKKTVILVVCGAVFIIGNKFCYNMSVKYCDIELLEGANFSAYHFLMMGLNEECNGTYSTEDVVFSSSIPDYQQRKDADIAEVKNRLENMIEKNTFTEHFRKKILTNFADGTFAWGQEGNFIVYEYGNTRMTPVLKSIIYPEGENYHYYKNFKHMIWLVVLFSCIGILGIYIKSKSYKMEVMVLLLALMGSAAFQMLFEARARYLYIYFPVYLIAAIIGWKEIVFLCQKVYKKKFNIFAKKC